MTAKSLLKRPVIVLSLIVFVIAIVAAAKFGLVTKAENNSTAPQPALLTTIAATNNDALLSGGEVRQMQVDFRGDQGVVEAMKSGQAQSRALAAADFNGDAAPDLVAGFALNRTGIITIQLGNTDAFAPKDESVYERMQNGYNPDSLLKIADSYQVPEPVDFMQVGNFNQDNMKDILFASRGGNLYLLPGDGQGGLGQAEQIELQGTVTAVNAGEFRAPDGRSDVAVAINGAFGPELLIYDGLNGLSSEPIKIPLTAPANAIEFGEMDSDPFMDISVATTDGIDIIHGWGRKQDLPLLPQVERINPGSNVRGLAVGFFIWNRESSKQIATLEDDGTIRIFQHGLIKTQPFSDTESSERAKMRLKQTKTNIDAESVSGWALGNAEKWTLIRELATDNAAATNTSSRNWLSRAHVSFSQTDDLLVLTPNEHKLDIVRQVNANEAQPQNLSLAADFVSMSFDTADSPETVLALQPKLNGERNLVLMKTGSVSPTIIALAPTAVITVDRPDDPSGAALTAASVCGAGANDCSLRGAVQFANVPANAGSTINLGTATYTLNINGNGGCVRESLTTGNTIGDLEVNNTTTMMGTGQASTIINQVGVGTGPTFTGDRVLCMNVNLAAGRTYTFSAMTIAGGRDVASGVGGGGFIGGAKDTTLNLTNVTFANNQTSPGVPQGPAGGGGVAVTGGNMTVTSCTFGAANLPGASRTSLTLGNAANNLSGGGLSYSAGDPLGSNGATGTLTVTGTTFTHNTSSSVASGGAGLEVYDFNVSVGTINVSTSAFISNQATGTASGGGIFNHGVVQLNISTTSFTNNSAGNRGGGLYVGGGNGTNLDGTTPSITFSGNTAGTAGSSISAAGAVTVSGTNTTVGGDLEITTNGIWTNSAGSAISPTNFIMTGTANFIGNNSTTNVGGNFNFGSGTFNAGTGTFNFNGTTAQSITNSSLITFNNLTDSNTTQPLTLNNSFAVNGALNINGANAIFAPVAAAVISGTGTLTGTGTARVTRIGADSFFNQYTISNKTLTNLTVEYIGAGAQTASTTTYNNLKINNGSGVSLGAGTTTVNGTLTLQTGALNVGTSTLVINNGTTLVGGSLTSGATGTVNYNQSGAGQSVIAGTYGNLTFSAFTKVLASSGTIGVAGTFNPNGVTSGHTINGSTIDFNATGAQNVPVFSYNNLTISGARGGATVTLTSGAIGVAGTFNPSATGVVYSLTGNSFDFNGTGTQSVAAFNYNNLTISGNRGGAAVTLASGNIGIAGIFNPSVTNNTFVATGNTVIFNGSGAQTIPAFTFNGLTLNNAGGANLGGNVAVGGALTLTSGVLAVGTNTLTLNGAVSAAGGSLTSAATGTVNYNQGTNGQATVLAANYGNLTFSNFSKTLASTGTLGVAGTFTPGTGTGHTITGSTIDFNGSGGQTIPGFTYNNLTSSSTGARTLDAVNTIKIAGVFTPGTNAYTITGSTVEYNGTAAQTLPSGFTTYNNLTLNNAAGVTGFAGLNVLGLLRVQTGTFTSSSTYNNVQIDAGATMAATAASTINVSGSWTNNGSFTPSTGTVNFNGSALQTFDGTFFNLSVNNAAGVNLGGATTVNGSLVANGTINVGSNTLILNSGVSGSSGINSSAAGTVNYNQSSNGQNVLPGTYGNLTFSNFTKILPNGGTVNIAGTFTTGAAGGHTVTGSTVVFSGAGAQTLPAGFTFYNDLTVNNASGLNLAGNITVNGLFTLTNGNLSTATNTLAVGAAGSAVRTNGHVIGNFQKTYAATGNFDFTIGTVNGYSPVQVNVTAGTFPLNFTVRAEQTKHPNGIFPAPTSLKRYWTVTPSGGSPTATMTFNWLDPTDIMGDETQYKLARVTGGTPFIYGSVPSIVINPAANSATITDATIFSDWTLAQVPTAANVSVGGRVLTADGIAVSGAQISMVDGEGNIRQVRTNPFGYYRFTEVPAGATYTVNAVHKWFEFAPQVISVSEDLTELNFIASP